jgi:signal transduction histidine kinase
MPNRELLLLALDDSPILQLMGRALRAADYELAIAQDAPGMNKSLDESSPALVLIGETFGGRKGLELSKEMLERFPTLPILLYAEHDTSDLAKRVLKGGLSGYLYPPLKTNDILEAVEQSIARARRLGDWLRREVKRTTASLEQRATLSESDRARYESIFENIQDGVIVMDKQRNILFLNPAVRKAFELGKQEVTGKPLAEAIPHPDIRALLGRAAMEPLNYHEINLDTGQILNAQFTPIPEIGSAITLQDISYLKELDRLKNDFVHTVSHDLRSPLTSLLGYAELIDRVGPLTEQQRDFLQRIQASVQHITTLVNDLLDLGRLEAGFDTRRETVQIGSVLKYTLDTFENQVRTKNLELTYALAGDIAPLRANPIRIRQLLDNLLGNAIKYTPMHGKIHVSIATRDQQIILEVRDSGPGIPQAEQGRIFEKFYRASNVPDGTQGTGLGLAIVKSIVENYHGRIWVESTPGNGSSFFVVLPANEATV